MWERSLAGPRTARSRQRFGTAKAFGSLVRELRPLIERIELLAPALSGAGPNAEYPWAIYAPGTESRLAPAEYDFPSIPLDSVGFRKLIYLVRLFLQEGKPA